MCLKTVGVLLLFVLSSCYVPQDFQEPRAYKIDTRNRWDPECTPITLVVSSEFDSRAYELVQLAAEYWNSLLGEQVLYSYLSTESSPVFAQGLLTDSTVARCGLVYVYPVESFGSKLDRVGATRLTVNSASPWLVETGEVQISRHLFFDDARFIVIAHELGHVLGILQHNNEDNTDLMSPSIGDSTLAVTAQELDTARHFSLSH